MVWVFSKFGEYYDSKRGIDVIVVYGVKTAIVDMEMLCVSLKWTVVNISNKKSTEIKVLIINLKN